MHGALMLLAFLLCSGKRRKSERGVCDRQKFNVTVNMLVVKSSMEIDSSYSYNLNGREMAGVCPGTLYIEPRAKGQG